MYRQNHLRAAARSGNFGNYEDYLRSLEMRCELGPFDTPHAERITQLINKTNQFNLTTRRYTAAEVEALMNDPACVTLYGRLLDKFGDNGIVTALIGRQTGDALDIELWIMSCRTFKRNLEYALFDRLVDVCRERGIKTINGIYLPTAKNLLVADFYATIGFEKNKRRRNGLGIPLYGARRTYTAEHGDGDRTFIIIIKEQTRMNEQQIFDAVQNIFRDNFDDDSLVLTRETTADDIEDWDSLSRSTC